MEETAPNLEEGELKHIVIFHDECAFHANDYKQDYWLLNTQQVLKKKEQGWLIMTSGFICKHFGNLELRNKLILENEKLPPSEKLPVTNACVTICPSSKQSGDDYWNMDQMIAQVNYSINHLISLSDFHFPVGQCPQGCMPALPQCCHSLGFR